MHTTWLSRDTCSAGDRPACEGRLDKGGVMMAVVFESKEAYVANATDPAQDRWYQKFRALLASDPEWNDGEVIAFT